MLAYPPTGSAGVICADGRQMSTARTYLVEANDWHGVPIEAVSSKHDKAAWRFEQYPSF
jgi:hypothetical protein